MSQGPVDDLDALFTALNGEGGSAGPTISAPARFVVVTDWEQAAAPYTLLRAFVFLVPPGAPVSLTFAVPHAPSEADAECVHVLLEGLGAKVENGVLDVQSFDEVAASTYDTAYVPSGDTGEDIQQVGSFILRLNDVVRRAGVGDMSGVNSASADALRERLRTYSARRA